MSRILMVVCALVVVVLLIAQSLFRHAHAENPHAGWSDDDVNAMRHLRLSVSAIADRNKSNELLFRDDAIDLGRQLFNDTGLSSSGQVACASCHRPDGGYQDTKSETRRLDPHASQRAPGLLGVALQDWFFWDGRADSLWSQALEVIENTSELASDRLQVVRHLCARYEKQFPALLEDCHRISLLPAFLHASPRVSNENWQQLSVTQRNDINKMFVLMGKSIAAFEAGLIPPVSRFDLYVDALTGGNPATFLSDKEVAGLKLFLDPMVGCVNCHNGPMFSNSGFFAVATDTPGYVEHDRKRGIKILLDSEFNCLKWGGSTDCPKLQYIQTDEVETAGAYKVPSLRNLRYAPAYMHDGRYRSLEAVIEHYRNPATMPLRHVDIRPAPLLPHQRGQLLSFLKVIGAGASNLESQ